jgi:hypothetical protein
MTDRILVVTPPDDTLLDGIRIAHVNLNEEQSAVVSSALMNSALPHTIINYVWKIGNKVDWLLDKIVKCDLIIFNADGPMDPGREIIIGWTAAQPQSYYFGNLKDLHLANNRAIYTTEDVLNLLEIIVKKHEQTRK